VNTFYFLFTKGLLFSLDLAGGVTGLNTKSEPNTKELATQQLVLN
jgi:hypothetical protein